MWDLTRIALEFFHEYLPFHEMEPNDALVSGGENYCLAKPGAVYAVYLSNGEEVELDLENNDGEYTVQWYNPREGGELQNGEITEVDGRGMQELGMPPKDPDKDWAILVERK